jgi:hypothetical protein
MEAADYSTRPRGTNKSASHPNASFLFADDMVIANGRSYNLRAADAKLPRGRIRQALLDARTAGNGRPAASTYRTMSPERTSTDCGRSEGTVGEH